MAKKATEKDIMVEVFNNDTGSVSYYSEYNRIKRLWDKPDSVKKIELEEIKDQMNTRGGAVLFQESILLIKDNAIREELGLSNLPEFLIDNVGVGELLKKEVEEIKSTLENAPDTIKEKVASIAIEQEIKDMDKIEVVKDITGVDVYSAIKEKKEEKQSKKK
jgi:hypothetical protein